MKTFDRELISADNFVFLPLSAQALFFHLVANANDDGKIFNAKAVTRCIGASEDDLDTLEDAGFIVYDESGCCYEV